MNARLFSIVFIVAGGWLANSVAWARDLPTMAEGGLWGGWLIPCELRLEWCQINWRTCDFYRRSCGISLDFTEAQLQQCHRDLAACTTQAFPATGQTTCWDSLATEIPCGGTGYDGDIRAGATLAYTDNGNGTITDDNTGLMWMKQDNNNGDCGNYPGNLDKDCKYTWYEAFTFVASLNANNHAGHTDWRVPNAKELQSIVNYENLLPAVSAEFDTGCVADCTVETCSCTRNAFYLSSTSWARSPGTAAWEVAFSHGYVGVSGIPKDNDHGLVRAVRGGL